MLERYTVSKIAHQHFTWRANKSINHIMRTPLHRCWDAEMYIRSAAARRAGTTIFWLSHRRDNRNHRARMPPLRKRTAPGSEVPAAEPATSFPFGTVPDHLRPWTESEQAELEVEVERALLKFDSQGSGAAVYAAEQEAKGRAPGQTDTCTPAKPGLGADPARQDLLRAAIRASMSHANEAAPSMPAAGLAPQQVASSLAAVATGGAHAPLAAAGPAARARHSADGAVVSQAAVHNDVGAQRAARRTAMQVASPPDGAAWAVAEPVCGLSVVDSSAWQQPAGSEQAGHEGATDEAHLWPGDSADHGHGRADRSAHRPAAKGPGVDSGQGGSVQDDAQRLPDKPPRNFFLPRRPQADIEL